MRCNWLSCALSALASLCLIAVAVATVCKDTDLLTGQDIIVPSSCTSLDLDSSLPSVYELVNDLSKSVDLRKINDINLRNNYLEIDDMYLLANYIVNEQSKALTSLDVRGNNITTIGINLFIDAMATRSCLELPEINILIDNVNLDKHVTTAYMNTNILNITTGDIVTKKSYFNVKQDNRKGSVFAITDKMTCVVKWDNEVTEDSSASSRKSKENTCFLRKVLPVKTGSSFFGNYLLYLQILASIVVVGTSVLIYQRQKAGAKVDDPQASSVVKEKKELTPKEINRKIILTTMSEASQKVALGKDEILPILQHKCPSYAKKVLAMILAMDVQDIVAASDNEEVMDKIIEEAIRLIEDKNKKKQKCIIS